MSRLTNWFGWSIHTIAAVYETDAAARELEVGLVNEDYLWAAFNAEQAEEEKDRNE